MTFPQEHAYFLEISQLRYIIAEQKEQIATLQEQITALLKENQELKEKLGANSSNSSKPP